MGHFARSTFACLAVLAALACGASASNLGAANDYSIFMFDHLTIQNTDCTGRIAVGGNAEFTSYGVANGIKDVSIPSLVVGGNLKFTNGSVNGPVHVGGSANVSGAGFSCSAYNPAKDINFTNVENELLAKSTAWSKLTTHIGSIKDYYKEFTLTGTYSDYNVFNLTSQQLSDCTHLYIDAPKESTVLVNVSGPTCRFANFHIDPSNNLPSNNIIYNFADATSLYIYGTSVEGSVLAPKAAIGFAGDINGNLIGNSLDIKLLRDINVWNSDGEVHNVPFTGSLPDVPEPPCWLIVSMGGALVSAFRMRRR